MKNILLALFGEGSSVSMLRLMSLLCCLAACKLALSKGPDEIMVITALLTAAFGGKVAQKAIEVKNDK